tara:strand:- start:264 stop:473 length:210 start_codon:yes stop_codon:yes gene_type:complete
VEDSRNRLSSPELERRDFRSAKIFFWVISPSPDVDISVGDYFPNHNSELWRKLHEASESHESSTGSRPW